MVDDYMKNIFNTCGTFMKLIIIFVIPMLANLSTSTILKVSTNGASNRTIDLTTMALKLESDIREDIYSAKDTFMGDLTGYSADCPLCGGHLACYPSLDVLHGNVNFLDETYGNVRIVASSSNLPCGSVVRFNASRVSSTPVIAIVLDRGVLNNDLDLLMESEDAALKKVGRIALSYDVLRFGWTK